jgi:superoxide dismutase
MGKLAGFLQDGKVDEVGNVAGFTLVLVMDVWEHAFLLDYAPAERLKYIDAFFANIDNVRLWSWAATPPLSCWQMPTSTAQ